MATARTKKAAGKTTNLTASRGNAGKNKANSILKELRSSSSAPDVIYGRNGRPDMNARERREWASNASGRRLSSRVHVSFVRNKALDKVTTSGGIRRTLEGYKVSYSYS